MKPELLILLAPLAGCAQTGSQDAQRPNILFCLADDASYHHFSNSGCPWVSTPNFDRVAHDGITFSRCYTPNAKSAPSRAILLTGRYSWQLAEAGNHITNFPADIKVFTEVLTESGYNVGFTGKSWAPGNPGTINGKKRLLTGTPYQDRKTNPPTKQINRCDYAANFSDFLDDQKGDKPWFFWFGSTEPHRGYEYGSGERLGGKSIDMIEEVPAFWPDTEEVRNDMLDYGYEIEYYDSQIGKMLEELERRGMLDNTLVVITSDNGMPFPRCKANDYEYANHMPCAMMWKKGIKKPGREVASYVSFIDMAPTFLDLAGVDGEALGMKEITGVSLKPFFENRPRKEELERRRTLFLGRERDDYGRPANQGYPIRAIIRDNYLLIWNVKPQIMPAGNPETGYLDVDGSPTKSAILNMNRAGIEQPYWDWSFGLRPEYEFYDMESDPYCVNNLAGTASSEEVFESMRSALMEELARTDDPRLGPDGDIFDSYAFDSEEKWNFFERVISGEVKHPWEQTKWVRPTDYEQHPSNKR
ncbi:MAG: sulfatase [Bacteroidales bacterium]|nr:sulfatase [Bacteroidales bacterium]